MHYAKQSRRFGLVLLAILITLGCSGIKERIEENMDLYSSYPAEIQEKISRGVVEPGFDKMQVYIALGAPRSKTIEKKPVRSTDEQGNSNVDYYIEYEKWTYSTLKECTYKKQMSHYQWARKYSEALKAYKKKYRPEKGHKYEKRWRQYLKALEDFEIDDYGESKKKRDRIIKCDRSHDKGNWCPPAFKPPPEYTEETYYRRCVRKYLHFYYGFLSYQEVPGKTVWLEPAKDDIHE